MKTKTGKNQKLQRNISRILSFIMITSVLSMYGCKDTKIEVGDYPMPTETVDVTEDNTKEETQQVEETKPAKPEVSDEEALKPEVNTFKEEGKFVYNPKVIPDWILEEFENDPKIIRISKEILVAVDNAEEEYVFDEDLDLTDKDLEKIYFVLSYSCPFYSQIFYTQTENENVYSIKYFPDIEEADSEDGNSADLVEGSAYGNKGYNMTGFASHDEAVEIMDSYKDYVTNLINENLNSEMSEKEMAAIIYSELVRGGSFSPENSDYYLGNIDTIDLNSALGRKSVDNIINQKYSSGMEILRVYQFIMLQLHIESRSVAGGGFFKDEVKEQFGNQYPTTPYWVWLSMKLDGDYYNCDIILEKLLHDFKYGEETDVYPEMTYFGMSDDKRTESYKASSVYLWDVIDTKNPVHPPKCPDNYEYHYFY